MELDDIKKAWRQEDNEPIKNQNIMELLHQKSRGPIASLKTTFRKQVAAVTVMMICVTITFGNKPFNTASTILFSTYIGFCFFLIAALLNNYRVVGKMEHMDSNVRTNLEEHVQQLERQLKWQAVGARVVIVILILLLEVLPHYQHVRMLDKWHALPPFVRFGSYAAYLIFQYFLSRAITRRKFGQHISYLKKLMQEVQQ